MKYFIITVATISVLVFSSSCATAAHFDKRKYTAGQFHDLNILKNKSEKGETADTETEAANDSCKTKMERAIDQFKESFTIPEAQSVFSPTEMLNGNYPVLADRLDSTIARQIQKDSTWQTDMLPDAIETAFSGQAMLGLGTVGGLVCMAAPNSIWFFIIPMIGAPFFLLVSLIAAAVAMGKINRGEIDQHYRKWMKLWAVCMVINLIIGSIVLMHYAFV